MCWLFLDSQTGRLLTSFAGNLTPESGIDRYFVSTPDGYLFGGKVVKGAGIGRGLGFPTANVQLDDEMKLLPSNGVYEVNAVLDGCHYKGVMNIGVNPTVCDRMLRSIEVHLIDFGADIYGRKIVVEPLRRLRGEVNFGSIEALKQQIGLDVERVKLGI